MRWKGAARQRKQSGSRLLHPRRCRQCRGVDMHRAARRPQRCCCHQRSQGQRIQQQGHMHPDGIFSLCVLTRPGTGSAALYRQQQLTICSEGPEGVNILPWMTSSWVSSGHIANVDLDGAHRRQRRLLRRHRRRKGGAAPPGASRHPSVQYGSNRCYRVVKPPLQCPPKPTTIPNR
jgi:hypothetical protein